MKRPGTAGRVEQPSFDFTVSLGSIRHVLLFPSRRLLETLTKETLNTSLGSDHVIRASNLFFFSPRLCV